MVFNAVVLLVGLLLASIEDIKTREIPDLLSYILIAIGIISGLILSLLNNNIYPIASSVAGLLVGAIIGLALYYSGQWGGGDTKILMGAGALIGVGIKNFGSQIPLLLVFIINIFIAGAIVGLIWSIVLSIIKNKEFRKEFLIIRTAKSNLKLRRIFMIAIPIVIVLVLINYYNILRLPDLAVLFILLMILLLYFGHYLSMFIKAVEKSAMIKEISPNQLVEGDWVVSQVKIKGKIMKNDKTGINASQIKEIIASNIKKVKVKDGMPFLPSFLLAYIALLIFGNWIMLLI